MNRTEVTPAVFDVAEAAQYLHIGLNAVRTLLGDGQLVGYRTAHRGAWHISRHACDEYVARMEQRSRAESLRVVS